MISAELLESAELILGEPAYASAGVWPRAAALLARQALETAMLEFWMNRAPGVEWCSTSAQLLCLPDYVRDREVAENASHTWNRLSRICHHHQYELLPTAAELRALIDGTGQLLDALTEARAPS